MCTYNLPITPKTLRLKPPNPKPQPSNPKPYHALFMRPLCPKNALIKPSLCVHKACYRPKSNFYLLCSCSWFMSHNHAHNHFLIDVCFISSVLHNTIHNSEAWRISHAESISCGYHYSSTMIFAFVNYYSNTKLTTVKHSFSTTRSHMWFIIILLRSFFLLIDRFCT